ncbi:MAG TPA: MFS transporter [Acidimicrobiales bacterium]|nr:MFS transporter [Acidimicrobiales bacterium]
MRRASPRSLLEPRHIQLLVLLGAASFFEGYDFNIVTVALKPLRTTFGIGQAGAAVWIAVVYLGALPAVPAARRADRHGRRNLLLWSILGYTLATGATAAAPGLHSFVACQFVARFFLVLQSALVWTVVAEELPAGARGLGFGWLAMLSALGTGWSAILWGAVMHPLGLSWRWLYLAALPVLVVVIVLRQRLGETDRFRTAASDREPRQGWHEIIRPPHRRRLLLLCAVAILANLTAQATVYVVDFMQTQRHLSASAASLTLVASGALAIPVLLLSGSLSDRVGRKPLVCGFLAVSVAGFVCFFFLAHGELALLVSLALVYLGIFGSWPTGAGFGTELFPTRLRAFGNSFGAGAKYLGQATSFVVAGALIAGAGNLSRAVLILSSGPLVAAVLIAAYFPETGGRELEEISPPPGPLGRLSTTP